jgi:glycosyltransferase involved in cell wall biosynthesis
VSPHVAFFLPSLEGGGAERSFVELANQFVARGIRVDFVLAERSGPYLTELSSTIRLVHFNTRKKLRALIGLTRYLRRERPDVLLAGLDLANAAAVIASMLAGMPSRCVISQRSMIRPVWQLERPHTWPAWLWLLRQAYVRARLVICNSRAAYDELTDDLGVRKERCAVVYNAVDVGRIESLARERVTDSWLSADAAPLVIAVGSFQPIKDLPTLLRAFAIVRRTRKANLLLLGEGPDRGALESLARELGIEDDLRMPGFMANPFPWISGARVLVSASLIEGCPNVIQQALACATPIVATDCPGGTAEVLENGRWGRLVPVRDAEAMARAIIETFDAASPPDGKKRAADFDSWRTADTYLTLMLAKQQR